MSKLEFKPEDFISPVAPLEHWKKELSDQANKRLAEIKESWKAEMLKDATVVYGNELDGKSGNMWEFTSHPFPQSDTHKALLINIEPIVKKCAKHKPHTRKFDHDTTMYDTWVCECGVELVAEWKEKK